MQLPGLPGSKSQKHRHSDTALLLVNLRHVAIPELPEFVEPNISQYPIQGLGKYRGGDHLPNMPNILEWLESHNISQYPIEGLLQTAHGNLSKYRGGDHLPIISYNVRPPRYLSWCK